MSPFETAMQEVLEGPRYDILTGRAIDYQQVIMEAIGRALISLLERIYLNMPDSPAYNLELITLIFVIVAALVLLGASTGLAYFFLRRRGRRATSEAATQALFDDIAQGRFSLSELLRLSREYEEKRQFRDAVRHSYIAVLVALDEKRTISVDKSKTNAQLARELNQAAPGLHSPFVAVVDMFHQSWFGLKTVEEEGYYSFRSKTEELL